MVWSLLYVVSLLKQKLCISGVWQERSVCALAFHSMVNVYVCRYNRGVGHMQWLEWHCRPVLVQQVLTVQFTLTHLWWCIPVCVLGPLCVHSMLQQGLFTLYLAVMNFIAQMESWHSKVNDHLCLCVWNFSMGTMYMVIVCVCVCTCCCFSWFNYMWQAHLETASYAESRNSRRKSLKMAGRFPFVTRKQSYVWQSRLESEH